MNINVLSALLVSAMIAGPALAQNTGDSQAVNPSTEVDPAQPEVAPDPTAEVPAATTTEAPAASTAVPSAGSADMALVVPEGYMMTELTSVTGDQLKGVDIYDPADSKIAEIADVVIGSDDKVTGIVTDVGGFLGLGEHRVSLSPDQVAIYKNADDDIRAYVSMTKDELKALPKYEAPNQ
ncbi:hypothetical protein FNJ84_21270 [Paracoccus sp. M683]|uniref:PRC-barrel domain-containing protein n=1 Tax=Paracoccus sp. M683 TaxID=2594268 RepID=UPI00117C1DE9|nr:PRC-barrel domain-containing protein [Paracoccus sp. M683]TRW92046.1 hypothetical protein FNJ84_21270 [Paracoccus sp. M683]